MSVTSRPARPSSAHIPSRRTTTANGDGGESHTPRKSSDSGSRTDRRRSSGGGQPTIRRKNSTLIERESSDTTSNQVTSRWRNANDPVTLRISGGCVTLQQLTASELEEAECTYNAILGIERSNIESVLQMLVPDVPDSTVLDEFFSVLVSNQGSAYLDFPQFCVLLRFCKTTHATQQSEMQGQGDEVSAFSALGGLMDRSGFIDQGNLATVCARFGLGIDIDEFMAAIDEDGNGQVEYDEFKMLLASDATSDRLKTFTLLGCQEDCTGTLVLPLQVLTGRLGLPRDVVVAQMDEVDYQDEESATVDYQTFCRICAKFEASRSETVAEDGEKRHDGGSAEDGEQQSTSPPAGSGGASILHGLRYEEGGPREPVAQQETSSQEKLAKIVARTEAHLRQIHAQSQPLMEQLASCGVTAEPRSAKRSPRELTPKRKCHGCEKTRPESPKMVIRSPRPVARVTPDVSSNRNYYLSHTYMGVAQSRPLVPAAPQPQMKREAPSSRALTPSGDGTLSPALSHNEVSKPKNDHHVERGAPVYLKDSSGVTRPFFVLPVEDGCLLVRAKTGASHEGHPTPTPPPRTATYSRRPEILEALSARTADLYSQTPYLVDGSGPLTPRAQSHRSPNRSGSPRRASPRTSPRRRRGDDKRHPPSRVGAKIAEYHSWMAQSRTPSSDSGGATPTSMPVPAGQQHGAAMMPSMVREHVRHLQRVCRGYLYRVFMAGDYLRSRRRYVQSAKATEAKNSSARPVKQQCTPPKSEGRLDRSGTPRQRDGTPMAKSCTDTKKKGGKKKRKKKNTALTKQQRAASVLHDVVRGYKQRAALYTLWVEFTRLLALRRKHRALRQLQRKGRGYIVRKTIMSEYIPFCHRREICDDESNQRAMILQEERQVILGTYKPMRRERYQLKKKDLCRREEQARANGVVAEEEASTEVLFAFHQLACDIIQLVCDERRSRYMLQLERVNGISIIRLLRREDTERLLVDQGAASLWSALWREEADARAATIRRAQAAKTEGTSRAGKSSPVDAEIESEDRCHVQQSATEPKELQPDVAKPATEPTELPQPDVAKPATESKELPQPDVAKPATEPKELPQPDVAKPATEPKELPQPDVAKPATEPKELPQPDVIEVESPQQRGTEDAALLIQCAQRQRTAKRDVRRKRGSRLKSFDGTVASHQSAERSADEVTTNNDRRVPEQDTVASQPPPEAVEPHTREPAEAPVNRNERVADSSGTISGLEVVETNHRECVAAAAAAEHAVHDCEASHVIFTNDIVEKEARHFARLVNYFSLHEIQVKERHQRVALVTEEIVVMQLLAIQLLEVHRRAKVESRLATEMAELTEAECTARADTICRILDALNACIDDASILQPQDRASLLRWNAEKLLGGPRTVQAARVPEVPPPAVSITGASDDSLRTGLLVPQPQPQPDVSPIPDMEASRDSTLRAPVENGSDVNTPSLPWRQETEKWGSEQSTNRQPEAAMVDDGVVENNVVLSSGEEELPTGSTEASRGVTADDRGTTLISKTQSFALESNKPTPDDNDSLKMFGTYDASIIEEGLEEGGDSDDDDIVVARVILDEDGRPLHVLSLYDMSLSDGPSPTASMMGKRLSSGKSPRSPQPPASCFARDFSTAGKSRPMAATSTGDGAAPRKIASTADDDRKTEPSTTSSLEVMEMNHREGIAEAEGAAHAIHDCEATHVVCGNRIVEKEGRHFASLVDYFSLHEIQVKERHQRVALVTEEIVVMQLLAIQLLEVHRRAKVEGRFAMVRAEVTEVECAVRADILLRLQEAPKNAAALIQSVGRGALVRWGASEVHAARRLIQRVAAGSLYRRLMFKRKWNYFKAARTIALAELRGRSYRCSNERVYSLLHGFLELIDAHVSGLRDRITIGKLRQKKRRECAERIAKVAQGYCARRQMYLLVIQKRVNGGPLAMLQQYMRWRRSCTVAAWARRRMILRNSASIALSRIGAAYGVRDSLCRFRQCRRTHAALVIQRARRQYVDYVLQEAMDMVVEEEKESHAILLIQSRMRGVIQRIRFRQLAQSKLRGYVPPFLQRICRGFLGRRNLYLGGIKKRQDLLRRVALLAKKWIALREFHRRQLEVELLNEYRALDERSMVTPTQDSAARTLQRFFRRSSVDSGQCS